MMKKYLFSLVLLWTGAVLSAQNHALHFDGMDDLVIAPGSPSLEITNGTVELWVKPEDKATSQTFICYRNSSGSLTRYLFNFLPNLNGIGFWNGSAYFTFNYDFNNNQWYHLAFVGGPTQTKIFIDGQMEGCFGVPFGTATGSSLQLVLGNDIPLTEFFRGEIDEVRIWDRALCEAEIMNFMNCTLTGDEVDLIASYNFNQGTAGGNNAAELTLQDLSPNGLDGTLTNFSLNGSTSNWVSATNGAVAENCNTVVCPPSTTAECPPSHQVYTYYLITSDSAYAQGEYDEIKRAMKEIQGWYQAQMGGKTFSLGNPENLIVVNLPNTSTYYLEDYWGRIQNDMIDLGYLPFSDGKVNIYIIKGGGGVALGAQWCGADCGLAMFGMYPQDFFGCSSDPGEIYPCSPIGAAAHELGHCFGLPHPVDFPSTSAVANHSVMQTFWNYPYNFALPADSPWGLLTLERQTLLDNPFFLDNIPLVQENEDLPIVNLPDLGNAPIANFTYTISDKSIILTNTSANAIASYWTFGNKEVSHEDAPFYTYSDYGTYTLRLRVLNDNGMMDLQEEVVDITCQSDVTVDYYLGGIDTINAGGSISTTGPVEILSGDSTVFRAGNSIVLKPGFTAAAGSGFHAFIGECPDAQTVINTLSEENTEVSDEDGLMDRSIAKPKDRFQLFPNPTTGVFHIKGDKGSEIKVFDHFGRLVLQQSTRGQAIDLSNHPDGLYIVILEGETKVVKRLVKMAR